jgi:gamma-glutamyltranspeptidase / glutathione hydrolase
MTPTFVFKDSKLFLATGSPGGPTIINTVLEVITNVIDHGMPVQQAVEAPRFHHQWMPDLITFERYGLSPDTEKILAAMGHKITAHANFEGAYQGDGESVMIDPKTHLILGAADPRKDDSKAVGY